MAGAVSNIDKIKQLMHPVDKARKTEVLIHLLKSTIGVKFLVFVRTKDGADSW